tara:strand:- start:849 stop:1199 length:351 start_codon:yes stop_codon:yes gene_type:complete
LTALLSGCSLLDSRFTPPEVRPVEIITVEKAAPVYHPPLPNQITAMPVEWKVLTPDTMEEYLNDLEKGEAPSQAFYGLTNKGYENLSNNIAEIKRYIRQLLSINEYYRNLNQKEKE